MILYTESGVEMERIREVSSSLETIFVFHSLGPLVYPGCRDEICMFGAIDIYHEMVKK